MEKYLINDEFKNVKSKVDEYLEKNNIHQFININQGEYARNVDLELEDIQYVLIYHLNYYLLREKIRQKYYMKNLLLG